MKLFVFLSVFIVTISQIQCEIVNNSEKPRLTYKGLSDIISTEIVRSDAVLARGIWDLISDQNLNILADFKNDTQKLFEVVAGKFPDDKTFIDTITKLEGRNIDATNKLKDIVNQTYTKYGKDGSEAYLTFLNLIDEARNGKSTRNHQPCNKTAIKEWREEAHTILWHGMGRTKDIFHHLSVKIEKMNETLANAANDNDYETVVKKLEDATKMIEQQVSDFHTYVPVEILDIWNEFVRKNGNVAKQIIEECKVILPEGMTPK